MRRTLIAFFVTLSVAFGTAAPAFAYCDGGYRDGYHDGAYHDRCYYDDDCDGSGDYCDGYRYYRDDDRNYRYHRRYYNDGGRCVFHEEVGAVTFDVLCHY